MDTALKNMFHVVVKSTTIVYYLHTTFKKIILKSTYLLLLKESGEYINRIDETVHS